MGRTARPAATRRPGRRSRARATTSPGGWAAAKDAAPERAETPAPAISAPAAARESAARPAAAGIGEDPGGPGGMGGAGAAGGTGTGRPPGGLSPIGAEEKEAEDVR
jgi:hypothetical protein